LPLENPIKEKSSMKNYIILITIFVSFITFAYSGLFEYDLIGGTQLNGAGCVCHTIEQDTSVTVWIEGPDSLETGQTGIYRMYLTNGPAEAGGYNVAGRFGIMSLVDSFSVWDYRSPNELTQAFPLVFPTPQDTIYWEFAYTAPDSVLIDTLYSCGLSIVYDHIPDLLDRWNFGPKFPVVVTDNIIPVEFISFTSSISKNNVTLNWTTATETNNMGFEVERSEKQEAKSETWKKIGFVDGYGTITVSKTYFFDDNNLSTGNYQYRLKQIDFDGSFRYSTLIEVEIINSFNFALEQNYPNPFNPTTNIQYALSSIQFVSLKVYDVLGKEVATIVNEEKPSGNYEVEFDASHLSSGVYLYTIKDVDPESSSGQGFVQTRKMLLMK
jgi:hypothetical protein